MRPVAAFLLALALAAVPGHAGAAPAVRHAAAARVLPWIADDWPEALRQAKARKLPIFVENWAPW